MQIRFTVKCIQYMATSVLQREHLHVWCKTMLDGHRTFKSFLIRETNV